MHEWTDLLIEEEPKTLFAKLRIASLNLKNIYHEVSCQVLEDAMDLSARVKVLFSKGDEIEFQIGVLQTEQEGKVIAQFT